ncbi:MAG TPA: hypothetical protein VGV93_07370, partial [Acidimicrobiales bacterium]|nr:hypothetical protein [Acidimicrobiales bacterium]
MDLRALRSAIHRGDAEAVVSVVASAPWDGRLQLVGDALVMAVERRQPGAEELARRCAEAGRERGWDGDEELAEGLERALVGRTDPLKPLPVDLELLSDVLEQGLGEDPGRLDVTTGEVWPASAIEYAFDAGTGEAARLSEPDRWVTIEPEGSDEAYRDMVLFVTTVSEPDTAAVLGRALGARARSDVSGTALGAIRTSSSGGTSSATNGAGAGRERGSPSTATAPR